MVSSRLKSVRSRAARACSIAARCGWSRSRLRYRASSLSVLKSVARMSRQGRAPDPVGHRMLRGRAHQPVERHDLREPARPRTQPGPGEDRVQGERLPQLMADVDRPGFPGVLAPDLVGVDGDHVGPGGGGACRAGADGPGAPAWRAPRRPDRPRASSGRPAPRRACARGSATRLRAPAPASRANRSCGGAGPAGWRWTRRGDD